MDHGGDGRRSKAAIAAAVAAAVWLLPLVRPLPAQPPATAERPELPAAEEAEQLRGWWRDLDAGQYEVRKAATDQLVAAGQRAVPVLRLALSGPVSVEQALRGLKVLERVAVSGDAASEEAAQLAVRELSQAGAGQLTAMARASLNQITAVYQERALQRLQALGARWKSPPTFPTQTPVALMQPFPRYALVLGPQWKGTARDLQALKYLADLEALEMEGEGITDDYLSYVGQLESLRWLTIKNSSVGDAGWAHLAGLDSLQIVVVWYSPLTDDSLPWFLRLKQPQLIQVFGTAMAAASGDVMRGRLPGTEIDFRRGAFLGVGPQDPANLLRARGCRIGTPQPNSAAEKAELKEGDVIVRYDDQPVTDFDSLKQLIARHGPDEQVQIEIEREGQRMTKTVTLGRWQL